MTKNNSRVLLRCKDCGFEKVAPVKCPVTGHVVENGWTYICPNCKGSMEPKEIGSRDN